VNYKKLKIGLLILTLTVSVRAQAEEGQAINVYIENDSRHLGGPGSDNEYSNGVRFSYVSANNNVPAWAEPVMGSSEQLTKVMKESESNFSISLAQQIYTPNDTQTSSLIVNDRPYAGWLYVGFAAHFKSVDFSQVLEADVGVVGPAAGGSTIQNGFHKIIGIDTTQGWGNQLNNEPTLQLSYQQRLKYLELHNETYQNYFDMIPYFGGALGNVFINVHIGGMLRLGTHLPNDFGPTRASSPEGDMFVEPGHDKIQEISFYGFVGGRGEAVAHNIFLDGNTFTASHHVHKNPFVFETEFGFGAIWSHWGAVWQFVTRSPEFEETKAVNSFASISLSYRF
jgi:lipid A 3-O-deacylase